MYGDTFPQACERLSKGHVAPLSPVKPTTTKRRFDAAYYGRQVDVWQYALCSESGKAGQDYLYQRGLRTRTWITYRLGFRADTPLPGTNGKERAPAITIPWYAGGQLVGVRYRFLEQHNDIKKMGRGNFKDKLWGGPALSNHWRTLVICEGELNAASIYQIAGHTMVDVLSTGSQSHTITPAMERYFCGYDHVIFWLDEHAAVIEKMGDLRNATGFSPGKDANDLLQSGELGGILSALRLQIAEQKRAVTLLQNDLQYGADTLIGIDGGTAAMLGTL